MKYQLLLRGVGILCCLSISCKKFLEESSQDELKPSTIQEMNQLMAGEGYPYHTNLSVLLNIVTDDVENYGGQGYSGYESVVRKGHAPYTWSKDMVEVLQLNGMTNSTYVNSWKTIYQRIAGCNVIISFVGQVSGKKEEKENLRGQALAMRAYYYLLLINLYAKPYNDPASLPDKSLGVPLKLDMEVSDEVQERNTVDEVYKQIENDLLQAIELLTAFPLETGIYKMSAAAAFAILARVYLYQEDWDKTIYYSDKALDVKSTLMQFMNFESTRGYYIYNNGFSEGSILGKAQNRIYDPVRSTEIIWTYSPYTASEDEFFVNVLTPGFNEINKPPYSISQELVNLYDSYPYSNNEYYVGDIRSRLYFNSIVYFSQVNVNGGFSFGFVHNNGGKGAMGIRTAELYLNRAEANIQKYILFGDESFRLKALEDINLLRESRYDKRRAYDKINIQNDLELYRFYQDERRRELAFEGHRWFDLRRYGMPSITHYYEEIVGTGKSYVLEKGDSRYTFQIPIEVMNRNPKLIQNP